MRLFRCCCPTALELIHLREADASLPMQQLYELDDQVSLRRASHTLQRRAAVVSETSEIVASARWRSAFQAVRRSVTKDPESIRTIVRVLRTHELFAAAADRSLNEMAQHMHEQQVREGEAVVRQGDAGDMFYVVAEGNFATYVNDPDSDSFVCIGNYGPGDSFGELALLYDCARVATVRCTSHPGGLVYGLGRIDFRNMMSAAMAAAKMAVLERLANVPILAGLTPEELGKLGDAAETVRYSAGEYLVEMGAVADALYVLLSGGVTCHMGTEQELRLGEGAFFGESCLQYDSSRSRRAGHSHGDPSHHDASPSDTPSDVPAPPRRQANVVAVSGVRAVKLFASDCHSILGRCLTSGGTGSALDRSNGSKGESPQGAPPAASEAFPGAPSGAIPFEELEQGAALGTGSFGCVRLAVHRRSGKAYALKAMHKGHLILTGQTANVVAEKTLLRSCRHPFLAMCHGAYHDRRHVYLLLGLAQGGELFTLLQRRGTLNDKDAAMYTSMVACALGFLSARGIAHRDLKLENLLIDSQGYLKLVDFGFAKVIADRSWTFCGTPDYLAPEIVANMGHNRAVDWWALGVLLYEMLHGQGPFAAEEPMATYYRIRKGKYHEPFGVSSAAKDLVRRLLLPNPALRLGMLKGGHHDVTTHSFCAHIDIVALEAKQLSPPFVPPLSSYSDTSNFDAPSAADPSPPWSAYDTHLDARFDGLWAKEFD